MGRHKTAGYYGLAWMDFMEKNHPDLVTEMKQNGSYEEVAWSVSCRAVEYCDLLKKQYAKQNPPPKEPDEYRSWKFTRDFYIDSAVMREKVLVAVTTPQTKTWKPIAYKP